MTALEVAENRDYCLGKGMSDRIAKPLDPVELDAIIRHWMPIEKIDRNTGYIEEDSPESACVSPDSNPLDHGNETGPMEKCQELLEILQLLRTPLIAREPSTCDSFVYLFSSEHWDERYQGDLHQIVNMIENYQFNEALVIVDALIDKIRSDLSI